VPTGADWLHEVKFDGYRVQVHKTGREVEIFSRNGHDFTSLLADRSHRFPNEIYMQIAGSGQRLSADALREAIGASVTLQQMLLQFVHSFMTQTTETALAN
jgi:ATP-dependent DNA ligase